MIASSLFGSNRSGGTPRLLPGGSPGSASVAKYTVVNPASRDELIACSIARLVTFAATTTGPLGLLSFALWSAATSSGALGASPPTGSRTGTKAPSTDTVPSDRTSTSVYGGATRTSSVASMGAMGGGAGGIVQPAEPRSERVIRVRLAAERDGHGGRERGEGRAAFGEAHRILEPLEAPTLAPQAKRETALGREGNGVQPRQTEAGALEQRTDARSRRLGIVEIAERREGGIEGGELLASGTEGTGIGRTAVDGPQRIVARGLGSFGVEGNGGLGLRRGGANGVG